MKTGHWSWSGYWQEWRPCNCTMPGDHAGMTLTSTPPQRAYPANEDHIIRGEN